MSIPDLIDNRKVTNVTLKDVLKQLLSENQSPSLTVATAYFNLEAFQELSPEIECVNTLRLLIGKEQEQSFVLTERLRRELEDHASRGETQLPSALRHWQSFLEQSHVEIRLYTKGFLHGKAYLIDGVPMLGKVGIVGSSNFTGAGLQSNLELNAVLKQAAAVKELQRWLNAIWEESEDYKAELLALLSDFTSSYSPYELYIKVLYEASKDRLQSDLKEEEDKPSPIALADFQHDGYLAAKEILEHYGGVLIADSVGLGKTYLALRLLDDYAYQQRETALIVCPAALRDTLWEPLLNAHAIPHRILSMEKISQSDFPFEEFAAHKIIVVDESHNFRNPNANRWENLFRLLSQGDTERKVILLTATPVNNTVFDLYHQISLITKGPDDFFADAGISNLRSYFKRAEENRDTLYELLEAIAVRRSRSFIRNNFPEAYIEGKPIRFPERRLHNVSYSLEKTYTGELYSKVAQAIENLFLAPYQVDLYRKELMAARSIQVGQLQLFDIGKEEGPLIQRLVSQGWSKEEAHNFVMSIGRQTSLAHIMRVLYLKRLESSVEALRISLHRQRDFQKAFLHALDQGRLLDSKAYRKWFQAESADDQVEDEVNWEAIVDQLPSLPAEKYDLEAIRKAVQADIATLDDLLSALEVLTPEQDDKLRALKRLLTEELKGQKVLVFSYYKDTARYLYNQLRNDQEFLKQLGHDRMAITDSLITSEERKQRIFRFAPKANNRHDLIGTDRELMLLISTDVISEGQNLQDAAVIINYDLHWNPVRMIQRIGRIDRIGSEHELVHVYNFFPEDALESLLGLMQRLYEKLDAINRTVGLDASVLGETPNPMDFNILRRIGEEDGKVLDELEAESELTVGEFLMEDLWDFLKKAGEERLSRIPLGMGTGKDGKGQRGFFAAFRHTQTGKHYWLFEDLLENRIVDTRLEAIRPVRSCPHEEPIPLPEDFDADEHRRKLLRYLTQKLNRVAHRMPKIPSPQNQVLNWLHAMSPSALRNELLSYFSKPLPAPVLRELRAIWRLRTTQKPQELMQELKGFAEAHPHPPEPPTEIKEVKEEDFECIAWIALV